MTRRRRRTRQRRCLVACGVVAATVAMGIFFTVGAAVAYWVFSTNTSLPVAMADTLPQGATPSATLASPSQPAVTITFPTKYTFGGTEITSYSLTRYDAYTDASAGSISGTCAVVGGAVSCSDSPGAGSWEYTDTPTFGTTWLGPPSTESSPVFIATATDLGPASGAVGSSAQVSVQGFAASTALTVTVGRAAATIVSGGTTDPSGAATLAFTVPSLPKGAQSVVVSDGSRSATSGAPFTVDPAVSLSSSNGTDGATGLSLTGAGYVGGTAVSVTFAGSPVILDPASPLVAADGTWSARFTVPNSPNGPQIITASDSGGSVASTDFTTVASATDLRPQSGAVGTTGVTIDADGFLADHALTVTVGGADALIVSGGTTDANGSSELTFTIPDVPGGVQSVVVSDGTNSATSATGFTVESVPVAIPPTTPDPTTSTPPGTVLQTVGPPSPCADGSTSDGGSETCADNLPPPPGSARETAARGRAAAASGTRQ